MVSALLFERIFSWFETRIDPLVPLPDRPVPRGALSYLWFFVSQARWAFAAMLVLGGLTALIEAALYVFVGDLVDMMETGARADFVTDHAVMLALMAGTGLLLRPAVARSENHAQVGCCLLYILEYFDSEL